MARLCHLVLALVLCGLFVLASATMASAHPLGNFTVNRYARVELTAGVVRVYYVVDLAEIPAFQQRDAVAADRAGYLAEQVAAVIDGLDVEVDGQRIALHPVATDLSQPAGQAGLTTLRIAVVLEGPLPAGAGVGSTATGSIVDSNQPERIGWREIVVEAKGDTRVVASTAPATDISDELRSYPTNYIQAPLNIRHAEFSFVPGTTAVAAAPIVVVKAAGRPGNRFTELITRNHVSVLALAGMLGIAALVGAGHALAPGHGKTVMAAYLVGTRGRPIDAVLLGVIVSAMHTASVLVLGLALFQIDRSISLDDLLPALTLVSGLSVIAVGGWLAYSRSRALRRSALPVDPRSVHTHEAAAAVRGAAPVAVGAMAAGGGGGHDHDIHVHDVGHGHAHHEHEGHGHEGHGHDGHAHEGHADEGHGHEDHDHGHGGHDHGPGGHSHELPEGVAPLSRRGLVVLATAGGIVPSPSAAIVLISAFTLGRVGLGLALVAAFSVGLAVTLTGVGLAMVLGGRMANARLSAKVLRYLPVLGAVTLIAIGVVLTVQGARQL